jgi:ParB family chromosome partitioning protein
MYYIIYIIIHYLRGFGKILNRFLVDSNLQREEILPSEKALAYKIKMEALKRRAGRRTKNPAQVELNYEGQQSRDILGKLSGDSGVQVSRYIPSY